MCVTLLVHHDCMRCHLCTLLYVHSCCAVGTVRVYDYINHLTVCMERFNQPATALKWMPECVSNKHPTLIYIIHNFL